MPAYSRWDLIRGLKGQVVGLTLSNLKPFVRDRLFTLNA